MILDDILELTLYQTLFDTVQVRNILHYQVDAVGSQDESGLATAFNQTVLPELITVQSDAIIHNKNTVLNLTDDLGFADVLLTPAIPGSIAGSDAPPFQAYSFRKNRATRLTRSGQMRVAGVPKAASDDGILAGTFETIIETLATTLGATISDGTGGVYTPVIVRKDAAGKLNSYNGVASFEFVSISTQNTRKYGKGI